MLRELSTLNISLSAQEEAVISLPENVLLIGRSGTGKTTCGRWWFFFFFCVYVCLFPCRVCVCCVFLFFLSFITFRTVLLLRVDVCVWLTM
jgi:hypothetical protein